MEQENKENRIAKEVLDAYFLFRRPLPENGAIQQNLTTQQIQDELEPMMLISLNDIIQYMSDHEFSMTTEADGSVAWAVWRIR
ncbi:MAG: hypothetical protein K5683_02785 [Prevotella sp.]|nr:hypothetical protein [Prevotella sp.]